MGQEGLNSDLVYYLWMWVATVHCQPSLLPRTVPGPCALISHTVIQSIHSTKAFVHSSSLLRSVSTGSAWNEALCISGATPGFGPKRQCDQDTCELVSVCPMSLSNTGEIYSLDTSKSPEVNNLYLCPGQITCMFSFILIYAVLQHKPCIILGSLNKIISLQAYKQNNFDVLQL